MGLMSALLLCAFTAAFQQGLGLKTYSDTKLNTSSLILNPSGIARKKILININSGITELQDLYKDAGCLHCTNCMSMAIKALGNKVNKPNELYYEVLKKHDQELLRRKRSANNETTEKLDSSKGLTITKYLTENGKVSAIMVNDTTTNDVNDICKIYIVKKSYPCGYNDSGLISNNKKKSKKSRNKKRSKMISVSTTSSPDESRTMQKRRTLHILDNSEIPESFMPSVEEYY